MSPWLLPLPLWLYPVSCRAQTPMPAMGRAPHPSILRSALLKLRRLPAPSSPISGSSSRRNRRMGSRRTTMDGEQDDRKQKDGWTNTLWYVNVQTLKLQENNFWVSDTIWASTHSKESFQIAYSIDAFQHTVWMCVIMWRVWMFKCQWGYCVYLWPLLWACKYGNKWWNHVSTLWIF